MIGTPPETHAANRSAQYHVLADGKTLAKGEFGAGVLGQAEIDVAVEGAASLELQSSHASGTALPTLFWANARIMTMDGAEIKLSSLLLTLENVERDTVKSCGRHFHLKRLV